jgi:acetyl-CoA acyltransferase
MPNRDAVIVDGVRTAVGKRRGALSGQHAVDLSARVLTALAERNGLGPVLVDDVIWGGEDGIVDADAGRTKLL